MHYTNASFLYGASASSFTHTQTAVSIPTAVTALIIHSWGLMSSSLMVPMALPITLQIPANVYILSLSCT